jgi:RNA polymerase sigma factor (sigma-70 family)
MRPFEEVVDEHGPTVMRVCRALLGPVDAQDAWSETFLSALRAYPDLRPDSNLRAWLVTIAHRKAIDQIRSTQRAPTPMNEVSPEALATELPPSTESDLRAALNALPPKQRGAVVYRYLADLSYTDVARLIDSSEAAARRNAADGIARLRQTYRRDETR